MLRTSPGMFDGLYFNITIREIEKDSCPKNFYNFNYSEFYK